MNSGSRYQLGELISPGVRYMFLATVFFALMNVGVKWLDRIPAHEIVFFRALVSLIVVWVMLYRKRISPWGNNKPILLLRGIAGTVALTIYFWTVGEMPLATAVTLQYMSPIFTAILAIWLVRESPRPVVWLFFVIAFAGVVLIKGFDPSVTLLEVSLGLAAALGSGFAYNFVRMLKDTDDPLVVVFYFPLVTVPTIGVYTIFNWVTPTWTEFVILIAIGVSVTIAQIFMTMGYQAEAASRVAIVNYFGVIFAILFGWLLFNESIPPLGLVGILLIVLAVGLASRVKARNKLEPSKV